MSELVATELELLLRALKLGIWIAVVYDLLRIFRRAFEHNVWAIGVEDGLYWCYVGVQFFHLLYEYNEGRLRLYLIVGAMLGMLLYSITIGRFVVKACTKVIHHLKRFINSTYVKTQKKISKPYSMARAVLCAKYRSIQILIKSRINKLWKHLRNKLTRLKKIVKIILCKQ